MQPFGIPYNIWYIQARCHGVDLLSYPSVFLGCGGFRRFGLPSRLIFSSKVRFRKSVLRARSFFECTIEPTSLVVGAGAGL